MRFVKIKFYENEDEKNIESIKTYNLEYFKKWSEYPWNKYFEIHFKDEIIGGYSFQALEFTNFLNDENNKNITLNLYRELRKSKD